MQRVRGGAITIAIKSAGSATRGGCATRQQTQVASSCLFGHVNRAPGSSPWPGRGAPAAETARREHGHGTHAEEGQLEACSTSLPAAPSTVKPPSSAGGGDTKAHRQLHHHRQQAVAAAGIGMAEADQGDRVHCGELHRVDHADQPEMHQRQPGRRLRADGRQADDQAAEQQGVADQQATIAEAVDDRLARDFTAIAPGASGIMLMPA